MNRLGITQREAASRIGCAVGTVNRLVRDGVLQLFVDGSIDPASVDRYLADVRAPAAAAPKNTVGRTASQAAAERHKVATDLARLDYAQRVGELVSAADVESEQTTIARAFRDGLMSLPEQLAPELSIMTDQRQIELALRRHFTRFLDGQVAALHAESPPI